MANEIRREVYDSLKDTYDLGSFDDFDKAMNDSHARSELWNVAHDKFDLGSVDQWDEIMRESKYKLNIGGEEKNVSEKEYKDFMSRNQGGTTAEPKPAEKPRVRFDMQAEENQVGEYGLAVRNKGNESVYTPFTNQRSSTPEERVAVASAIEGDVTPFYRSEEDKTQLQYGNSPEDWQRRESRRKDEEAIMAKQRNEVVGKINETLTDTDKRIADMEKERKAWRASHTTSSMPGQGAYGQIGAAMGGSVVPFAREEELQNARVEKRQLENAQQYIQSMSGKNDSFLGDVAKSFGETVTDMDTWDFGLGDMNEAMRVRAVLDKADSGEQLSESEKKLLDAVVLNTAATMYYQHKDSAGRIVGSTSAMMIPFMIEMAANPAAGIGRAAQSATFKKLARWAANSTMKRYALRGAQGAARVFGDIGAGFIMAGTTGIAQTIGDAERRMTGMVDVDPVTLTYKGRKDVEQNGLIAGAKAVASGGIERQSELVGEYFAPLVGFVGKRVANGIAKGVEKFGNETIKNYVNKFADIYSRLEKSKFAKSLTVLNDYTRYNGAVGEYLEEVVGNIENATFVGDMNFGTGENGVFNPEDNMTTFLAVAVPGVVQGVLKLGFDAGANVYTAKKVRSARESGQKVFGDVWQYIQSDIDGLQIDGSSPQSLAREYRKLLNNYTAQDADNPMAEQEKKAIRDYFEAKVIQGTLGFAVKLRNEDELDRQDDIRQVADDEIAAQTEASDAEIDARVNQQSGVIVPAVMKNDNRQVYVVSGDVVMMQDGSGVDREKSSQNIIVRDAQTGELEFATPADILGIDEAMNPNELKTQAALDIQGRVTAAANAQIAGLPTFALNDALVLNTPQGQMQAVVTDEINADGLITVQVGNPYDGTARSLQFTPEELSGMVMSVNGKEVEKPSEDVTPGEGVGGNTAENETTAAETQPAENGAMPMIGEGEDAEPDFMQVEPTRARQWIEEESGLSGAEASMFVDAKVKEAQEEVKKAQKGEPKFGDKNVGTSIPKYNRLHGEWQAQMDAAQAMVDYWQAVKGEQQAINNAQRQEQLNSEVAAAQQAEEKRQAEVMAEKKAQQELGSNNVAPAIREKWDAAEKVEGVRNELVLANGERVPGRYVMVESGAATASHDALNGFAKSAGFPVDANEQSVNDRDYERDKDAQEITRGIAAKYDSRALQTPVVVSSDGVVLSGNGRTMAGELAARDNTDAAYIDYLKQYGEQYGFSAEQVESMQHPRVLFIPDNAMSYTAETFAKFNQQEMKGQSKTEQAVKLGKVVSDDVAWKIMQAINGYESLNEFYADINAATGAIRELLKSGVISQAQYAEMFDGDTLSSAGKEFIENVLIGNFFGNDSDTIRKTTAYKSLRQAVVTAMAEIGNNIMLGEDFFLQEELSQAIDLVYRARKAGYKAGDKVSEFATQGNLFSFDEGGTVADISNTIALVLADVLNDGRISRLKKVLTLYNSKAKESANGQVDMFAGIRTKKDIFNEIKQLLNYGTNEQQQAIDNAKEKRTNQSQADGGGSKGTEPTATSGTSSTGDGVEGGNGIAGEGTEQGGRLKSSVMAARAGDKKAQQELANFGIAWEKKPVVRFVAEGEVNSLLGGDRYMGRFGDGRVDVTNSTSPTTAATADYRITFKDRDDLDWSLSDRLRMKNEELGDGYIMDGYSLDDVATIEKKNEDGSYTTIYTAEGTKQGVDAAVAVAEQETEQEPTEGQKEAGNYKKGHVRIDGYEISIENPKGSVRRGTDASGKAWEQTMQNTYGYIRGTEGVDGDHIDVFLSDHLDDWNGNVYVIDQVDQFNTFDEHKVMYGFNSEEEARAAYLSNYEKGWQGLGAITEVSKEEFKKWVDSSHRKTKAFAEYKSVKGLDNGIAENTTAAEPQPAENEVRVETSADGKTTTYYTKQGNKAYEVTEFNRNKLLVNWENLLTTKEETREAASELAVELNKLGKWAEHPYGWRIPKDKKAELDRVLREHLDKLPQKGGAPYNPETEEGLDNGIAENTTAATETQPAENGGYTISDTTYTNKKGKTTAMHLVKFDRELTSDELRAGKELAKESRGWWDREKGGFMMRDAESAKALAESLNDDEKVEDAQPLSADDMATAADASVSAEDKQKRREEERDKALAAHGVKIGDEIWYKGEKATIFDADEKYVTLDTGMSPVIYEQVEWQDVDIPQEKEPTKINVESLFGALYEKGKTKLSDHAEKVEGSKWVDDADAARFEELRKRLKAKLNGQLNLGIDPEAFAIGVEMSYLVLKHGARKIAEYAKAMIDALGDEVRPYIKSFYNGARDLPEMAEFESELTPYDEVRVFDVVNFDKGSIDAMATAEQVIKEQEVAQQAEVATEKLKKERNESRKAAMVANDGTPLRKATEADFEKAGVEVYYNGEKYGVVAIMRTTEQTDSPMHFSHPVIKSVYLTNMQDAPLKDLYVADDGETPASETQPAEKKTQGSGDTAPKVQPAEKKKGKKAKKETESGQLNLFGVSMSELQGTQATAETQPAEKKEKPKTPWWSDDKRPQSLNPDDYRTYMTDEAKEYFAQFKSVFKKWTHPELAFITAAAWDGANIPVEVLMQIPEIQEAEARVEAKKKLLDLTIENEEKQRLAERLFDDEHGSAVFENGKIRKIDGKKEDFTGAVRQEKKAFVVIGRPAGGKSSVFANPLSNKNGARIIDSDTVKPWLDGFDDGYGAGYVQNVSADVADLALEIASDRGDNVVIPRIGGSSVIDLVIKLREKGYDVSLYWNDVSKETSIMRAASRFAEEGRYLSIKYLTGIDGKISETFINFAQNKIGNYYVKDSEASRFDGRTPERASVLVGGVANGGRTENTGREGTDVPGVVSDGGRADLLEGRGSSSPEGTFGDELIFSYAEWKSNDVPFGEKPKEIWNSRSGKPMPTEGKNVKDYGNGRTIQSSSAPVLPGESGRQPRPDIRGERKDLQNGRNDGGRNGEVTISSSNGGNGEVQSSERPGRYVSQLSNTEPQNLNNNHAERGKDYAPKGVDARIAANIRAIELMQKLIESGTPASAAQKAILRQYSGWGGLGKAFDDPEIDKQLRDLLGAEAYEQAQMSRNSAYYTPAMIIDSMWDVAKALGFNGGNVLEGSAGIGNIIGAMPREMSEHSNIHAVEIDQTTGNILSLLYPDAKVDIQGFEATEVENGSVDLAITNVPFVTGLHVRDTTGDKDLSKKFRDIHDFCIAKNVRKLREGGIGIFITSNGTLDKSTKLREWIVRDGGADVIGAFRLNNETFGGTGVTSDIIVIRKRVNGKKSPYAIDVLPTTAVRVEDYDTGEEKKVKGKYVPVIKRLTMDYNKYFVEHPEMMGGEMKFAFEEGSTFRPESKGLYPVRGKSQEKLLSEWVKSFEGKGLGSDTAENTTTAVEPQPAENLNEVLGDGVKEGSLVLDSKGKLCIAQRGKAVPLNVNANKVKGHTKEECFKAYKAIKTALADVLNYQTENKGDEGLPKLLTALNKAYDDFVRTYGHLHKNTAISFLRNDVDFSNILALETYSETKSKDGKITQNFGKTDVFKGRVIEKEVTPEPESVKDAVIDSVHAFGRIDIPWMTERLQMKQPGMTEVQVKEDILSGKLGYEDPTTKEVIVAYEYLSGNVREKLQQAKDNNADGRYNDNITALEKVVPMDIPAHLIEFNLGSSWIDPKVYEDYVLDRTGVQVSLINAGGTWVMKAPDYVYTEQNKGMGVHSEVLNTTIFGTQLIAAAIQNRTINVSKTRKKSNGETETIKDPDATAACAQKIDEIRSDFRDWARAKMQSDSELAANMERVYNDTFNYYAPKEIGEEFIPEYFPGANRKIKLQPHQAKAAINGTTQPLMLAHEVGSGKTFTMITTAMEMRRLGTARKPMLVVQNATVGQIVESAKFLYPNSKVLTIEEADRTPEGRKNFYAKIKYNDWDMIIVPQSVFERIPDSIERQMDYVKMKIEEKMITLEKLREQEGSRGTFTMQAENEIAVLEDELADLATELAEKKKKKKRDGKKEALAKEKAKVKALEMLDRETDDVEDFDDMGIDAILVDEAHEYKHLGFATAMQRGVKGIDPSYSKKSQGVYLKTQAVLEKSNGKNVIFATGTPISNTAAEIWTFMRYLMPAEKMQEYGIYYFDDFVRNFGKLEQTSEFTTSGKYKEVNRFLGYVNIPELVRIWSEVTDTVLNEDVQKARREAGKEEQLPKLENDKAEDIFLPQTKALRSIMLYVKRELDNYDQMTAGEKKRNSHIPLTMYGIAKAAAVDARLVDADAADEPQSKTNEAVRQTLRSLEETKSYKGTIALFADNYQNKRSGFNLYEDIRKKLIEAGVPAEQIVVITSGMSVKKKLEIFDKVNKGEIRVIMGSTFTLGTGVNIQERLHTLIHIDAPNRPMDYIQREGRMVRQGNLHKEWGIPVRELRFGVEDSLDVTAYQRLKTKKGIVDAIMNGKKLMANSMENRVLEEEEDVFGDTVAQLSGSEYAMLRNQAERDVRKYEAKKKQWEADQVYCHNQIPATEKAITRLQEMIEEDKANLAKVEAIEDKTTIVVGKQKFANVAAMADFIKEYNKALKEIENKLREDRSIEQEVRKLSVNIGGIDFEFTTTMWGEYDNNAGGLFRTIRRKMVYRCPALGIDVDVPCKQALLREGLEDIEKNVMTGNDFRENIEGAQAALERDRKNLAQLKDRYGKPFAYSDELEQAHKHLDEYTELMTKELEEKEKKYAAMDAEVDVKDITDAVEEEDDEEEEILSRESDEDEGLIKRVKDRLEEKYPGFTTAFDIMDFDGVPELFFGDKVAAVALYNKQYPNANAKINKAGDIEGKFHYPILIWGVQEFESAMKEVSKDGKLPGVLSDYVQDAMEMAEAGREEIIHSDNFKKFFGDWEKGKTKAQLTENPTAASKVVDADGKPMIVYHGTNLTYNNNGKPFWVFREGSHFGTSGQADEILRTGRTEADLSKVYPVYLNIRNPKRVSDTPSYWEETHADWWEKQIAQAKKEGYDGIVYLNKYEDKEHPADSWIAFYPQQIKSATENIGTFDSENEDIRFREEQPIFISNAMRAVEQVKQEKATGDQWIAMLQKAGGLKTGEDKWLGLSDWLKGKKSVTKQEVLDYIEANQIEVEDVEYQEGISESSHQKMEELQKVYEDIYNELLEERGQENTRGEIADMAFDEMVSRYGDDFREGFRVSGTTQRGGGVVYTIEPETGWDDEISEAALYYLGADEKLINDVRLSYTTEGLKNKREIALVVPTIDSWNEDDKVHFGDAGNGRAVAWARFGETTDKDGKRVLVIDEIQSKRHQEGREKGYYSPSARKEYQEYKEFLKKKYPDGYLNPAITDEEIEANKNLWGKATRLTDEEQARYSELKERAGQKDGSGVPDAPFDKNWHELALKRMLRYAAENDYDKVAWTTGEQQAERYNLGSVIESVEMSRWGEDDMGNEIDAEQSYRGSSSWQPGNEVEQSIKDYIEYCMSRGDSFVQSVSYANNQITDAPQEAKGWTRDLVLKVADAIEDDVTGRKDLREVMLYDRNRDNLYTLVVNREGDVVSSDFNDFTGKLSDLVGKDLATKILKSDKGRISGDDLRIGADGMKGFYDDILPRFMNKYGKKWNVKVDEVYLPLIGETMHSVDVTPEMKESVMEGQPLFRQVTNENTKEWLDNQRTVKLYRSMVEIDGKLYPPMSSKDGKELRKPTEIGKWEEAEEAPEKAVMRYGRWMFPLKKDNGKMLYAAYNPYIHSSSTMLNDQFSEAQDRSNLVVVEVEVPVSELAGGYRAYHAKDSTGIKDWKAGVIQGQLSGTREVVLSRWAKPVRVVPVDEVADNIMQQIGNVIRIMPTNVVTPQLRKALEKKGMKFVETNNQGKITEGEYKGRTWSAIYGKPREVSREGEPMTMVTTPKTKRYTRAQQEAFAERQLQRKRKAAEDTAKKLNILDDVIIVDNIEEAIKAVPKAQLTEAQLKARGWYRTKAGKIVIILGNHSDVSDVVVTMLHEGVAHYGLRKLFGKNFDTFLDNVFNAADEDVRRRIVELAKAKDWNFRTATEEYLASLAEDMDFEHAEHSGWWQKIKRFFMDMLRQIGVRVYDDYKGTGWISDNELRYILWRSYENLAEPGMYRNPFKVAEDVVMQSKLGVGNGITRQETKEETATAAEPQPAENGLIAAEDMYSREGEEEVTWSQREKATARDAYERMVSSGLYQFIEAVQDSMLGLKKLYQAVLGEDMKIEDVPANENAYIVENPMSSANMAEQHEYYIRYIRPLLTIIGNMVGTDEDAKEQLTDYMMAKHGLERNIVFAQRDAKAASESKENGDYDEEYAKCRENDYAGLTALTGEEDVAAAEAAAQQMVDSYEELHNTEPLWEAINAATGATLEKIYKSGLLSKTRYDEISQMFEYYIPLQGWDETTSDEVYGYLTNRNGIFGSPIKHAKGRRSKADDPVATIGKSADDAIHQGNRNLMKQRFLNFVLNHPSDLVSVTPIWLQYNKATEEWEPVFADVNSNDSPEEVNRKVNEFETRMYFLWQNHPDIIKRGTEAKNVPYKVVKGNMKEHQVLVSRNGEQFVLTINGNPRAAQALNGLTNPDVEMSGAVGNIMKAGEYVNRQISAFYTTRNVAFVIKNFLRDALYSNCMTWVRESPQYALRFHKNFGRVNPVRMHKLLSKWEDGTLDTSNELEGLFYQFMLNGGETGYTSVRDIEQYKRNIVAELKKQRSTTRRALALIGMQLDMLNRAVENCARFAAFVTSREFGRSVERSVYDAKEVSVNFNKKGAGAKMLGSKGQDRPYFKLLLNPKTYIKDEDRTELLAQTGSYISGLGRSFIIFWNASVQGMTNFGRTSIHNPKKAIIGAASFYILGLLIPELAKMMSGGDGDDDDNKTSYYDLPEYIRRSNICIRVGKSWLTIPLPIEFRAIYGLGELATGVISGGEHYSDKELSYQIGSQMSQILPLDMLEGGGGISPFIPSAIKPFVEAYGFNRSWSGLPIYKDTPWNTTDPDWTKAYKNTDKNLVDAAKWINEKTGGDDFKKGAIDINPAQLEYILLNFFSGYVKTAEQLKKTAETSIGKRDFDWRNIIIGSAVMYSGDERTANRKLQNEYFNYKAEYEETKRLLKKYEKAADEGLMQYAEKIDLLNNSKAYLRYEIFDEYKSDIDNLRKQEKEAVSDDEKKQIEAEMYAVMREMIDRIHETER